MSETNCTVVYYSMVQFTLFIAPYYQDEPIPFDGAWLEFNFFSFVYSGAAGMPRIGRGTWMSLLPMTARN